MLHIGLLFDYHNRARALHQLIEIVAQRKARRRNAIYGKDARTTFRFGNWWDEHLASDEADQQLLDCLNELWRLPGMTRQHSLRRLHGKRFIKYAERVLDMHASLFVSSGFAITYAACDTFIREEIARARWEHGMEYDSRYLILDEPATDHSDDNKSGLTVLGEIMESQSVLTH